MRKRYTLAFGIVALASLAACSGDKSTPLGPDKSSAPIPAAKLTVSANQAGGGGDDGPVPTLAQLSPELFTPRCTLCHVGDTAPAGLLLDADNIASTLVGVSSVERPDLQLVVPGRPEQSYLFMKLRGDSDIVGQQMPLVGPHFNLTELGKVRRWIAKGAPIE
ncbi:MAG: hypothetical protein GKR89_02265 [Candidatus Latescibacteria bacterium]|nr:hypothetical protein [Candidatus Latescibacterota bacterium]